MTLPLNWVKYTTDDGKDYYHNPVTNITQWDVPASVSEEVYKPEFHDLDLSSVNDKNEQVLKNDVSPTRIGNDLSFNLGSTESSASSSKGWLSTWCGCCSLELMQGYFDLSTDDFTERMRMALNPLVQSNVDLSEKPDFYGPFWIVTTAVIFLAGTANMGNTIMADVGAVATTDWSLVYLAAGMLYGALILVPVLVALILRISKAPTEITAQKINVSLFICVYGYSFLWLIPCSILAIVPSNLFKWLVVICCMLMSCTFVRNHLWADMSVDLPKARYALIALLFGSHAVIYVVYRMYFFQHFVKPVA